MKIKQLKKIISLYNHYKFFITSTYSSVIIGIVGLKILSYSFYLINTGISLFYKGAQCLIETGGFRKKFLILLSIFLISVSLFIYQVVLTRIYSAILFYSYVFLVTSFAVFGLGIGSIIAFKRQKGSGTNKVDPNAETTLYSLTRAAVLLPLVLALVTGLIYVLPYMNNVLVYIVLGTIPFIFGGYYFSIIFREFSEISNRLYFADLIGSGAGSIAVLQLLNYAGIYRTIIFICLISSIAAVIFLGMSKSRFIALYVLPVIFLLALFIPGQYVSLVDKNFNGFASNTSKIIGEMVQAGKKVEIEYTRWNAFSRTDVLKIGDDPNEMIVTIDGSAPAPMFKFDGKLQSLEKFKKDTEFLPFTIGDNNKVLVIGPGGGKDVLYALAGGSKDISAVEINTSSIDAVNRFKDYNGNIYGRPEVKVYGEDGRNFIRGTNDKYDDIYLSLVMTNTSQGVGYALSENYIYTVQAVEEYLNHLSDNGRLAFLSHDQDDLAKIVSTAILALNHRGVQVKDAPKYIALFAGAMPNDHSGSDHLHYPIVIVKNKPFTENESKSIVNFAKKTGSIPLYTPIVDEEGVLSHIKQSHISLAQYLTGFSTNVTPATDDNPYFYNFNKGIPPILLLILFIMAAGSVVLFLSFVTRNENLRPAMYFSLLGAGFMMIETPLIQKFILYLGHPVLAFTYVLAALLIGCGLGALASNSKLFIKPAGKIYIPPLLTAVINAILIITLGAIFRDTSGLSLVYRILISSLLVMVQGFFMGMPFPRGMRLLGDSGRSNIIPVMWGINGTMSVVGSVLSVILSMLLGFSGALIAGIIVYLLVALLSKI